MTFRPKSHRPHLEALEDRALPSITAVTNTKTFPASATVQIETFFDTNYNGKLDADDAAFTASGVLIDSYHVLTAGHVIYDQDKGAYTDWVFVHPGRNSEYNRPYGEVAGTFWDVMQGYVDGDDNYDLGLITLDRNVGAFTGTMTPRDPGASFTANGQRLIRVNGYPADDPYNGREQYLSRGYTARTDTYNLIFNDADVPTYHGNSGGPVYLHNGYINGVYYTDSLLGVVSRSVNDTQTAATRVGPFMDWINDVLDDDPPPVDKPDLVDRDKWFNMNTGGTSALSVTAGKNLSVSADVKNLGTKAASNVTVRFRLSTDQTYSTSDTLLGDATLSSVLAYTGKFASGTFKVPSSLAAGKYYVVWTIDPFNTVNEFQSKIDEAISGFDYNTGYDHTYVTVKRPSGTTQAMALRRLTTSSGPEDLPPGGAGGTADSSPGSHGDTGSDAPGAGQPGQPAAPVPVVNVTAVNKGTTGHEAVPSHRPALDSSAADALFGLWARSLPRHAF
jgi:V8-like Glu-specific endopeptidase